MSNQNTEANETAEARAAKFEKPGEYTAKDREKIPAEDFAGPDRTYPIVTQKDVHDAARLIGHAADPETVKAKVIAIAKRKGFELPDAWKEERAVATEETRAAGADTVEQVFIAPITRVDAEKRLVTVTATSESEDSFGTRFNYEASKQAFTEWLGNVREMHQPKAVGSRVAVHCDDEARKIDVTLRVSKGAQDTWEKVLDGTLRGASIGASNVVWETGRANDGGKAVPVAKKYSLVELSLVDNPSNPDCANIAVMRNAVPDVAVLDEIEAEAPEASEANDSAETVTADVPAEQPAVAVDLNTVGIPDHDGEQHISSESGDVSAPESAQNADATLVAAPVEPSATPANAEQAAPRVQTPQALAKQQRLQDAAEVRRAGEKAEREFPPRGRNEDPGQYYANRARARGEAELAVLRAQQQRIATPVVAEPEQPASAPVVPTEPPAAPQVDATDEERSESAADETRVDMMASDGGEQSVYSKMREATQNAPLSNSRSAHTHAHAHTSYSAHQHSHEHTHLDGTTHSHGHLHNHDHNDLHEGAPDMGHDHEHNHAHDHSHTYRSGAPTDSRLAEADAAERAKASYTSSSAGSDMGQKPGSGSQSAKTASDKSESPVMTVQPQQVGHLDLPNSQDAEALGFGVPEKADEPETPGNDSDELRTNPDDVHEGGHTPNASANKPTYDADGDHDDDSVHNGGDYDDDGDHDGDEDEEAREPDVSTPLASDPTSGASRPMAGDAKGRAPSDAGALGNKGIEGGHRSAAEADETRKGARNSAKDMSTLHDLRDGSLNQLATTCKLCNCPTCTGVLAVLNGGAYDEDGDHESGSDDEPITADDVATFGQQRVLLAAVQRVQQQQSASLIQQFTSLLTAMESAYNAQLQRQYEQQQARQQEEITALRAAFDARFADVELTIADAQRSMSAQFTQVRTTSDAETQIPDLIRAALESTVTTQLSELSQRMERVAEDASGLRASVERIEQQPVAGGPMAHLADLEHLSTLNPSALRGAASGQFGGRFNGGSNPAQHPMSAQERIEALTAMAQSSTDPNFQASVAGLILRVQETERMSVR